MTTTIRVKETQTATIRIKQVGPQGTAAVGIGGNVGTTDQAIVRANGTGGATIEGSLATVSDTGTVNIPTGQTYNINGVAHAHAGVYQPANANITFANSTVAANAVVLGDDGTRNLKQSNATIDANNAIAGVGTRIVPQSGNITFALGNEGITYAQTAANATHTIPANATVAFKIGTVINHAHTGTGTLTIALTSDTLVSDGNKTKVKLGTIATTVKTAATTWLLTGNLE